MNLQLRDSWDISATNLNTKASLQSTKMCRKWFFEVCRHFGVKHCPQNCGRVDTTRPIPRLWGWCPREECQIDQRQAEEMALKDAQMKAIRGYQHGAVASQESGAQKAVERAAFAHTEVGISPHMTGSTAMRIPIDEDSARAISEARTFKKKPRRPLPPEQQQSNEIAQRIV